MKKTISLALSAVLVLALAACGGSSTSTAGAGSTPPASTPASASAPSANPVSTPESIPASVPASEPASEPKPAAQLEAYSTELSSGHYTAGIDFPAGTYTITALSGSGNVQSSNMFSGGLNEVMSPEENEYTDIYIQEFKNAKLEKDVVLSISGVTVKIEIAAADTATMTTRENPGAEETELGSGNYVAGTDFPAGIYNIVAVNGSGNVTSDNLFDGGINAVMSPEENQFTDMYIQAFMNVDLSDGIGLSVSGVTVKLVPST